MNEIVVDCSVAASWILPDEYSGAAENLLGRLLQRKPRLVVPELWIYEVLNVLRSAVRRKRLTAAGARRAVTFLNRIPLERVPLKQGLDTLVFERALEHNLSACDAAYVVLAETRGATLCTADKALLDLRSRCDFIQPL